MVTTFEVRQQVRTVYRRWLETIYANSSERVARDTYNRLVTEHPTDYFELVKATRNEDCLDFTSTQDEPPNVK